MPPIPPIWQTLRSSYHASCRKCEQLAASHPPPNINESEITSVVVLWIVTPYVLGSPEDGGHIILRNVGCHLQDRTVSQYRRP